MNARGIFVKDPQMSTDVPIIAELLTTKVEEKTKHLLVSQEKIGFGVEGGLGSMLR